MSSQIYDVEIYDEEDFKVKYSDLYKIAKQNFPSFDFCQFLILGNNFELYYCCPNNEDVSGFIEGDINNLNDIEISIEQD